MSDACRRSGGLPLQCYISELNLHFVVVFLFGSGQLSSDLAQRHVDPLLSHEDNMKVFLPEDRIRTVAKLLSVRAACLVVWLSGCDCSPCVCVQEAELEADVVLASSIFWDLLQVYNAFAQGYLSGRHTPPEPFHPDWVVDTWLPNTFNQIVSVSVPRARVVLLCCVAHDVHATVVAASAASVTAFPNSLACLPSHRAACGGIPGGEKRGLLLPAPLLIPEL